MKMLTKVPTVIEPIMAMASGRWSSDPISDVKRVGTMAKMVVSEVIMIAVRRRWPAVCMASISGIPSFRSSLMASSFRMESLTIMPHVTIIPIADMRLSVWPKAMRVSSAKAVSIGISTNTMSGCTKLSNCAHSMKYISITDTSRITVSSFIILALEKNEPAKPTSNPSDRSTASLTASIVAFSRPSTSNAMGMYSPSAPAVMVFRSELRPVVTSSRSGM